MRKFAAVLLSVVLLAGCGGGAQIGRVGTSSVRMSDIDALYESGAVTAADFRRALFRVMAVEVIRQSLAADFQVTVEPSRVDEYLADLEAYLAANGYSAAEYLGEEDASQEMLRFNAEVMALRDAALDQLLVVPEVVDGLFADPEILTEVCSRHILVATAEEAEAVMARLEAGEDFAAVADEVSLDTGSEGGDLGCVSVGEFADAFAQAVMEAPIGEVFGPVEADWGFHVLIVSERSTPTREEYLADPRALLSDDQLSRVWSDWYNDRLQTADAWVNERYGVWTPYGIFASEDATTTTTVPGG